MVNSGQLVDRRSYVLAELHLIETDPGDRPEDRVFEAVCLMAFVSFGAFFVGSPWFALGGPVAAALLYGFGGASRAERADRPAAFTFRPWGVEAMAKEGNDAEWVPRRWSEIESYQHRRVEVSKGDNAREVFSVIRMRIAGVSYVTKCAHENVLELVEAVRERYAHEATRPIALGWRGATGVLDAHASGAFRRVLDAARTYLATTSDLRAGAVDPAIEEAILRALLERPTGAEHGYFAAIVAAELKVESALEALLALTLTPSPLLSAVARAAAQRLGAPPSRTFPIADVEPFVSCRELAEIEAWGRAES